jgi:hypothetical protein
MKEMSKRINVNGKDYRLDFNLNVMEEIQEEYGTIEKWGDLTDGTENGEPNAKAVIFGFRAMMNEGIDIDNEENGTDTKPLTLKQVGRIITAIGLSEAATALNDIVIDSTKDDEEKNA